MEWESDSPCHSHTYPGQGPKSHGRGSGWELEFRDCRAIPGWGLLLTVDRWIEGMEGKRLVWKMLVEECRAAMKARQYCWVTCRGKRHHHSPFLPTCQHRQLNNKEAFPSRAWPTELQSRSPPRVPLYVPDAPIHKVGPQPGEPLHVPDTWKHREVPQVREPSKCLKGQSYGERLVKEAFWSPAARGLKRLW